MPELHHEGAPTHGESVATNCADHVTDEVTTTLGSPLRLVGFYDVGREKIREFARAVQDFNAVHWVESAAKEFGYDELPASPTFGAILGAISQRCIFEKFLPHYDLSQVLHTEQRIVFWRPFVVGDRLVTDVTFEGFRQGHGQDTFVFRTDISEIRGEETLLQSSWTTIVARSGGGTADENLAVAVDALMMRSMTTASARKGAAAIGYVDAAIHQREQPMVSAKFVPQPNRSFESVSVGDELEPHVVELTSGDLVNYAGVSGDPNPIHWSDLIAKLVGMDTVVAHGMLTMGLGSGLVSSWVGDPGAIRAYGARFARPVFVDPQRPAQVHMTGKVKSLDEAARTAEVTIVATSDGKKIFGRAGATVQLG